MSEQETKSSSGRSEDAPSATANPLGLVLEAAQPKHGPALVSLFERASTPCHCQYWHFAGDKNAWLDRLFHAPELNRAAFLEHLTQPGLKGIVALHGEQAVGWMKLCLAESIPKLYGQRLYKGLPCFTGPRDGVLTVGCLLIDEELRRKGVARALVRHGVHVARQVGARAIEAFPRRSDQAGPAELWTGPSTVFVQAGFEIINDFGPYPVLRHELHAAAP